jgi:acyl-CoA synthetase (AMP-forming)/AMP-acid ligase II
MEVIDGAAEKPVDLRPLGPGELCYIQFSSGSTRHPHGVQITQAALMANLAGITGPGRPRFVEGRPDRELAAALSRHGPDRLHLSRRSPASSRSTI